MLAISSKNKTMPILLTQTMHFCSVTTRSGERQDLRRLTIIPALEKTLSAGTEVAVTQI